MRHFFTILGHEIRMLLVTPSTYVAAVLFLGVMGFIFSGILDQYSREPQEASPAYVFFGFFAIPALFMVPLLTMKCLAEERRLGTIETLLTTPVTTTEVVLGKYAAAYLLYLGLWVCTSVFFLILLKFAGDPRLLDPGPLVGGYSFVAISGMLFVAIGILASSLARNQAVAWTLGFAMLFLLIVGMNNIRDLSLLDSEALQPLRVLVDSVQVFEHFGDFSRGIADTRQVLFYLSSTALTLIFSILSVELRSAHS